MKDIKIQGFTGSGLVWQGDNGLIENSEFIDNSGSGILMNYANNNTIGGIAVGYYDVIISGNKGDGLSMVGCNDNFIQKCYIGIDSSSTAKPNHKYGIAVHKGLRNIFFDNVISGNLSGGLYIENENNVSQNLIQNNRIGVDFLGVDPIPNGKEGIQIIYCQFDTIRNNVVSGNGGTGIYVANNCRSTVITNNKVGVNRLGTEALPNSSGMIISGYEHVIENNILSGNKGSGLSVNGKDMSIKSNIIGLSADQKKAIPNGVGVFANTRDGRLVFGDTVGGKSNVVAGNNGDGILVIGAKVNNVVIARNVIGANRDTSLIFPNKGSGVVITHSLYDVTVTDNLICANSVHGIRIERNVVVFLDTTKPNIIQKPSNIHLNNNCIGCAGSLNPTLGKHGGSGISVLNADSIFIDHNIIIGTDSTGIDIANDSSRFIRITKNKIGPETNTIPEQKIGDDGIAIRGAKDVLIGSQINESDSNSIHFCQGHGISIVDSAMQVYYFMNSMVDNELGGIALDELKPYFVKGNHNDKLDSDSGSNGLQNTVNISVSNTKNDVLNVSGDLQGLPNTTYRIDVYLGKLLKNNESYKTQGSVYIGWFTAKTSNTGTAIIDTSWKNNLIRLSSQNYPFPTLTVSSPEGTSSFSNLPSIEQSVDIRVEIDTAKSTVDNDGNIRLVTTISNIGDDIATTVSVKDTLSYFEVKEFSISRGVIGKYDSTITATIPQLSPGESVNYTSYGKATKTGVYKRTIVAVSSEVDTYPQNNTDSISFTIPIVNTEAPTPKYPLGKEKNIDNPLQIVWYSVKDAFRYHLQVSKGKFGSIANNSPHSRIQASVLIVNDSTLKDTTYTVRGLEGNQTYYWRVREIGANNTAKNWSDTLPFSTVGITDVQNSESASNWRVSMNPNITNDRVVLSLFDEDNTAVSASIVDILGVEVSKIFDRKILNKGFNIFSITTSHLASGMYYIRLSTSNRLESLPLIIRR